MGGYIGLINAQDFACTELRKLRLRLLAKFAQICIASDNTNSALQVTTPIQHCSLQSEMHCKRNLRSLKILANHIYSAIATVFIFGHQLLETAIRTGRCIRSRRQAVRAWAGQTASKFGPQ